MRNKLIGLLCLCISLTCFFQACQSEQELNFSRYYSNGKSLYEIHCQNCHHKEGAGLASLIPPLTDTLFLKQNKSQLACIIKHGLNDTITVGNQTFSGQMPANHQLPDIDIAAIITYITNSFGNKQGLYDVSNASNDLNNCLEEINENK